MSLLNILRKKKNHKGTSMKEKEKSARMYDQPGDTQCPVASFKLYLSKLHPDNDAFFSIPIKQKLHGKALMMYGIAMSQSAIFI